MHTSPRLRSLLEAGLILLLRGVLLPLPVRWASVLGSGLGGLLYVLRVRRARVLESLEIAFGGETSPEERRRIAARCYRHFGALIAEFLCEPRLAGRLDDFITLENPEALDTALAEGKGVLLASGHLGNWELFCCAVAARGHPFAIYVGQQHNPFADAFVNGIRARMGMGTIGKQASTRGLLRVLKQPGILGMLSDQHFSRNQHFVRFFGRIVSAAPGLSGLMRHTGAPVLFAETYKVGRFHYRTRFWPLALPERSGDDELDALRTTQTFFDMLEQAVRRHPEQYFWMHRRWRTPPREADLSETNRAFLAGSAAPPASNPTGAQAVDGAAPGEPSGAHDEPGAKS